MLDAQRNSLKAGIVTMSLAACLPVYGQVEEGSSPPPEAEAEAPQATAPTIPKSGEKKGAPERIQVTGSRIRRVDAETSAPVAVISSEDIKKAGVGTVGDLFRKMASSSPTGTFEGGSNNTLAGTAFLDLLGLGEDRTLVLLNGKRIPGPSGANAANVNNIPQVLIDRIEILSGGASAVYGADAVGGVVNIVTRKNYEGTEVEVFVEVPAHAGGETKGFSVVQGVNIGDRFNISLLGGAQHENPIDKRNRRDLKYSHGDRAYTSSNPPAGTYSYDNVTGISASGAPIQKGMTPSANCPLENRHVTDPTAPQNEYCAGLRKGLMSQLVPESESWFAGTTLEYAGDVWTTTGLLNYSETFVQSTSGSFTNSNPYDSSDQFVTPARAVELGITPDPDAQFIRITSAMPDRPRPIFEKTYETFATGVYTSGEPIESWKTDFAINYAVSGTKNTQRNIANSDALAAILSNQANTVAGKADPAYIPIDPNRDPSLVQNLLTRLKSTERNTILSVDAFASTELFELPGGAFTFGLGAARSFETYKQTPDEADKAENRIGQALYTGSAASEGSGDRSVTSLYAEFLAPVTKDVDFDGALRFDDYSDFGSTTNYGAGLKYTLLPELALRGRAASSFKAPPLNYVYQRGGGGYLTITDPVWCAAQPAVGGTCDARAPRRSVYVYNPGNDDLDPETGVNYSVGLVYEPIKELTFLADYVWVYLKKTFEQDELQEVVDEWYENNPGSLANGNVDANTISVNADHGYILKVGRPYNNIGSIDVQASNMKLTYKDNIGAFHFGVGSDYFRMLSYKQKDTKDSPKRQLVRYRGIPAFKWSNSISAGVQNHMGTLSSRSTGKQAQDPETATAITRGLKIAEYTEYDFVYSGQLPSDTTISLGVNNIFDTIGGKFSTTAVGSEDTNSALYPYTGRSYFARVTQKF